MMFLWLGAASAFAQSRSGFPNPADPEYESTYRAYREQMAARSIISPALGYETASSKARSTQTMSNSPDQTGLAGTFSSIGNSIKEGFSKIGGFLTPQEKVKKPLEPTSVYNQARPSPDTYTAMARLCVESGRLAEAEQHYQHALQANPRHLGALLGYAKLKEVQGHPAEAMAIYQRAVSIYPQEAAVLNNAGLCYARNGQLDTAVALLHRAVQLQPKKPLYRNNLAMVLVEMGRPDTALAHLRAVYPEAVARYNLGQLLLHKGQWEAAAEQFNAALEADPSMRAAQAWLEELARRKANPPSRPAAEIARLPRAASPHQPEGSWSEITDLPSGRSAAGRSSVPSSPGNATLGPGYNPPESTAQAPSARLEHPRIYASPGGTFSSDPQTFRGPAEEEELAPLPPIEHPKR